MADIYEALDLRLRRRVAIKALHPEHGRAPISAADFFRRPCSAPQIDHPHVVPIFDHGEERALGGEPVLFPRPAASKASPCASGPLSPRCRSPTPCAS
ncbi:MAG: hypothetical protein IPK80_34980 [Nannocystis sp.]|nr:hypothetical protein [Nannocystis sp.]